jgi:hypothetical protein
MHMPSITANCLAVLMLACATLTPQTIRQRQAKPPVLSGGILLSISLLVALALPMLCRLPWADVAEEASEQVTAAIELLQAAYVILTL